MNVKLFTEPVSTDEGGNEISISSTTELPKEAKVKMKLQLHRLRAFKMSLKTSSILCSPFILINLPCFL